MVRGGSHTVLGVITFPAHGAAREKASFRAAPGRGGRRPVWREHAGKGRAKDSQMWGVSQVGFILKQEDRSEFAQGRNVLSCVLWVDLHWHTGMRDGTNPGLHGLPRWA